jgi:transposase-like protein
LSRWRREWNEHGARAFQGVGRKRAEESRVADLERKIGQQTREIDFLKRALQHVEEQRLLRALSTGAASTSTSKKKSKQGRV